MSSVAATSASLEHSEPQSESHGIAARRAWGFDMNRTYRGGSVTPDPSLFTAVMEGQWEIVREKVSP